MSGLRICMVTTFYPPYAFGGDAIDVQRLSQALVRRGHDVTVVHDTDAFRALHHGPAITERPAEDDDAGVRVIRLRSALGAWSSLLVQQFGRPVMHASRLKQILRPGNFDVVNFHNVSLIGGPGVLHYPRDAVTLYMAHEHWLVCPTHALWRFQKERCDQQRCLRCVASYRRPPQIWRYTGALWRAIDQLDTVIAMSEFSREKHRQFGFPKPMEVLPCFVPEEGNVPAVDARPHPRPFIFFAGRLEMIKGLDDVIPVFRNLPELDLVIAGDGNHGEALRQLAGGMANVHFLGRMLPEALRTFYQHAVAVIVPSVCYETFGIVVIEAFGQGAPVVARGVGPLPELVSRSGAGELFDLPEELERILRRLGSDPQHRASLAAKARPAVAAYWSEAVVVPAYLEIVRRAASARGHVRACQALASEAA